MKVFDTPADLAAAAGTRIGSSDWLTVDQPRIDTFAEATGDHQWIHVDTGRAATGPFGTTIAHGFLTLSLLPVLAQRVYRVEGVRMAVNYGLNKVRFITPVPVGSALRAHVDLAAAEEVPGGWQITSTVTIEIDGADRPACVADSIARLYN